MLPESDISGDVSVVCPHCKKRFHCYIYEIPYSSRIVTCPYCTNKVQIIATIHALEPTNEFILNKERNMYKGFGCIVTKGGKLFFHEPTYIDTCFWYDILTPKVMIYGYEPEHSDLRRKNFVCVHCPDWTMATFAFDEEDKGDTLPEWVDVQEVRDNVEKLLEKVAPIFNEYKRSRDLAEANMTKSVLEKIIDTAERDGNGNLRDVVRSVYEKAMDEKERAEKYARNQMIREMRKIEGYI